MSDSNYPYSKRPYHKSLCSEHLVYFVNKYGMQDYPEGDDVILALDRFHTRCIVGPLEVLSFSVVTPTVASDVEKMIASYNWYITNRFWGFQLLYPLVSFLRVYYSILLTSFDLKLCEDILRTYLESLEGEAM